MAVNLIIDKGNSRTKVSVYDGARLVDVHSYETFAPEHLDAIINSRHPEAAIYCSVSSHGEDVLPLMRNRVDHVYELTSLLPLPFKIDYATPSTLGRDRIAAAAGAIALFPGRQCLIVDAGTAVTYDVVSSDSRFVGGNIAPGLWMRAKALHDMTSRLPMVNVEQTDTPPVWGQSTTEAIKSGVIRGVVAEIEYYHRIIGSDTLLLLTGGDSHQLAQLLTPDTYIETPDLVNAGLNSILLYNETLSK